jgi:hypothetical protein
VYTDINVDQQSKRRFETNLAIMWTKGKQRKRSRAQISVGIAVTTSLLALSCSCCLLVDQADARRLDNVYSINPSSVRRGKPYQHVSSSQDQQQQMQQIQQTSSPPPPPETNSVIVSQHQQQQQPKDPLFEWKQKRGRLSINLPARRLGLLHQSTSTSRREAVPLIAAVPSSLTNGNTNSNNTIADFFNKRIPSSISSADSDGTGNADDNSCSTANLTTATNTISNSATTNATWRTKSLAIITSNKVPRINNLTSLIPAPVASSQSQQKDDDQEFQVSVSLDVVSLLRLGLVGAHASSAFLGALLGTLRLLAPMIVARRILSYVGYIGYDHYTGRYLRTTYVKSHKYAERYDLFAIARGMARCGVQLISMFGMGRLVQALLHRAEASGQCWMGARICHWWFGMVWIVVVTCTGRASEFVVCGITTSVYECRRCLCESCTIHIHIFVRCVFEKDGKVSFPFDTTSASQTICI